MAGTRKGMSDEERQLLLNVGALYKELRAESGLTQREAALALGTSQSRVPVLEQGQADVMLITLNRWANLYGYQVEIALVPREDAFDKELREVVEGVLTDG